MDPVPPDGRRGPAGPVVRARMVELTERLPVYDSQIRRHERGGVHKMRVTLRRLRSLLATFGPVFDAEAVALLREDLRWIAGELGGARDSEVLRERLSVLATTTEERSITIRMERELGAAESTSVARSLEALDSERYSQVWHGLNTLVTEPPWTPDADRSSDDILRRRVRREWKRLRRRVDTVHETATHAERRMAFHEVRKAAKRLRYSAQTLVPEYGDDARRLMLGAKRLQTILGELQDSALSQEMLREMTAADGIEARDVFVVGGLHAKEQQRSAQAEDRFAKSWEKVSRKRNRRWLT